MNSSNDRSSSAAIHQATFSLDGGHGADEEREAIKRIAMMAGPGERRSAVLALILTPGSSREKQSWAEETADVQRAEAVRSQVKKLSAASRLPVLERALRGTAGAPLDERKQLLAAARRVMGADGQIGPLDRLQWLAMRHLLRAHTTQAARPASVDSFAELPDAQRRPAATFTAFLARIVPQSDALEQLGEAGLRWYDSVVASWWPGGEAPACQLPDGDALAYALQDVQQLSWMLRPVLVRQWVTEAVTLSERRQLRREAADALRLACSLLDTPMPPALARCFVECDTA